MKNLIYYPTFEPHDTNWLKFALIYIDSFSPIIPENRESEVSDSFKEISETNLIAKKKLQWWHGDNAATKCLKEIEFVLSHPEQFRDKFNNVNIVRSWRDPSTWNFTLYYEKFNNTFFSECIGKGLGREGANGLELSKELAHFYMTFLVNEVAYEYRCSPITDLAEMDRISTYLRAKDIYNDNLLTAANSTVTLALPKNLREISIQKLIEFRKDSGLNELRQAFTKSLEDFFETVEGEFEPEKFILELKRTNKEFAKELTLFFGGITSTTLGATMLIKNPNHDNLEILKQSVEGTVLAVGGAYSIHKAWGANKQKRSARKYLSSIGRL